jgi:hypothetical protein
LYLHSHNPKQLGLIEAVIANHPEEFSIEAVIKANQRLDELELLLTV